MPPQSFIDVSKINQNNILVDKAGIYDVLPHRYEFQQLNGIYMVDKEQGIIVGFREVREDEFWCRGHIPGRPIFPGVLMIETAAQLVGYYVTSESPDAGFMGFAGVQDVKFRGQVVPGDRVIMVGKMMENTSRRCRGATQAFVNGKQVFEGIITGMWL